MSNTTRTPAPWEIHQTRNNDGDDQLVICCSHNQLAIARLDVWHGDAKPEMEANAEHITACVNACEGINPKGIPPLLQAARCALADLEGIMPSFEPSGDRQHPGWQTIEDLRQAIASVEAGKVESLIS